MAKASDSIMAKWYCQRGPRVAGIRLRGMLYAGHNMANMTCRDIAEPSLVDPIYRVMLSDGDDVPILQHSPSYSTISQEQRGEYLRFLSSDRTLSDTHDIGYVFMYLYGLERRVMLDKPSDNERHAIAMELLRLVNEFGGLSNNFSLYAMSLLLYNGTDIEQAVSDKRTERIVASILHEKVGTVVDRLPRLLTYEHLLLSRMMEHGIGISATHIAIYVTLAFLSNMKSPLLIEQMFGTRVITVSDLVRLVRRRYLRSDVPKTLDQHVKMRKYMMGSISGTGVTVRFVPAHLRIRTNRSLTDMSRMLTVNPSSVLPMGDLIRIASTAFDDVRSYVSLGRCSKLTVRQVPEITSIPDDVITVTKTPRELYEHLKGKTLDSVSSDMLSSEYEHVFGRKMPLTNGKMPPAVQAGCSLILASIGWQLVIPGTFDDALSSLWKPDDEFVVVRRPVTYAKRDGRQSLGNVFRHERRDKGDTTFILDDGNADMREFWDALPLAWLFGWLTKTCDISFDDARPLFPTSVLPESVCASVPERHILLAYAKATATYKTSSVSLRKCVRSDSPYMTPENVKTVLFSFANGKYGVMLPEEAVKAFESVYAALGIDKAMVLYDYHGYTPRNDAGKKDFSLDIDATRRMVSDTEEVQDMLADAIGDDATEQASDMQNGVKADGTDLVQLIVSAFGDGDELPVRTLQTLIMDNCDDVVTKADAMTRLSEVNEKYAETHQDELIDIDGATVYLN